MPLQYTKVSEKGRGYIRRKEELRLTSYRDAAGVWTIGYGHTKNVGPGQSITAALAEELFELDLMPIEKFLSDNFPQLDQSEFDALASLLFNVGITAFLGSKTQQLLSAGKMGEAAERFPLWNKARVAGHGGELVELPALTTRRREEQDIFLVGNYGKTWA